MAKKILILGGTREAAKLADELVGQGHDVTSSLAGRTAAPAHLPGKLRTGGFGGPDGLADFLRSGKFDLLIDATHPFAKKISANARRASKATGIPLEARTRPAWERQPGDHWIEVASTDAAVASIPTGARVFLALGSQHIAPFGSRNDVHYVVRMVDEPPSPLALPDHVLVTGKPGSQVDEEASLLQEHKITHIVCRNSGGTGAYAKIEAARNLAIPVIIISRPNQN